MTDAREEMRQMMAEYVRAMHPDGGLRTRVATVVATRRRGNPWPNWMPAIAAVIVIAITVTSVGVLLAARYLGRGNHGGLVSPARTASPAPSSLPTESPITLPADLSLVAPSHNVVWGLLNRDRLYRSTDQGRTWERRQLPPIDVGGSRWSFSFVDQSNGWMLLPGVPGTQCQGASADVWRTSDGATTWHRVSYVSVDHESATTLRFGQCKEFISFVDKSRGFVSAWDDNSPPTIYMTADGGATWKPSRLPDPPGFKTRGGGDALRAQEVHRLGTAYLVAAYGMQPAGGKGYVFRSIDGLHWTVASTLPNAAIAVAYVTDSRWLQVIVPGQSVETTDGGTTWHAYNSDYAQAAGVSPEVVFGDESVGYATVRGSVQRTLDGGLHWSYIKTPGVIQPG